METEASSESLIPSEFQPMDESLEFIFNNMIGQGEMLDAVEFICSIDVQFLPSTTIMKTLIFDVLMKSDCARALAYTTNYLYTLIDVYRPIDEKRKKFYFDSIRADRGFLADLWTVYTHIVKSYFIKRGIYVYEKEGSRIDPIKYPNCKFLLELYLKLFSQDFKYYKPDESASCLVMTLFWPNSDIHTIQLSNRNGDLLKWINDIYTSPSVNDMADLLDAMHKMLNLMVRCIIEAKCNLSDAAAFRSAPLADIVDSIVNFCKDAFSNLSNVKTFLIFLSSKYLQAKLCEKIIKQIIKVSSRKYSVLTLKDIVEQCMFPSKLQRLKNNNKPVITEKKELRKRVDKKYFADMKMETTKLHELCRKNRFADLLEELSSSSNDINARDPSGNTPLHEACSVGSRLCVRHLIDEGCSGDSQTLDFAAFNLEGITPLHIAVMENHVDIAKMLLSNGGPELLTVQDNKGQVPADLSRSDLMNKLLQEYEAKPKESNVRDAVESDSSADSKPKETKEKHGPAPNLKSFKEYSIYLDALNCLLCNYCDIFNLYDYVWKRNTVVSSHSDKTCCHFTDNKNACSEDAVLILKMPAIVEAFMKSITKNASKSELTIDIELIPLKGFAASLKSKYFKQKK